MKAWKNGVVYQMGAVGSVPNGAFYVKALVYKSKFFEKDANLVRVNRFWEEKVS